MPLIEGHFLFIGFIMFNFFRKNSDFEFVESLVDRLRKELPPALMAQHHKVLSVNKITRLLERTSNLVVDYQAQNALGYFRRVSLINSFKWSMKEVGYPDDFVRVATESLVVALAKKK